MPRLTTQIPETYEAITRPVAYDVIRAIGELLHMPGDTEILLGGTTAESVQSGSTLSYEGMPSKFSGHSRIQVTMTEGTEENMVLTENANQENQPVCFLDRGLGVRLRPIYASTVITLSFNIRSRSRAEAAKIRDEMQMRSAMGRRQILHSATYGYGIPDTHVALLQDIYALREQVAGYGDTFDAWLKKHASKRLGQVSDQAGANTIWMFGETQNSIQGIFDFNVAPESPDKSDDSGSYNYPIEYKFRYDKVVGMSMDYPLVVHNQQIPEKWHGIKQAGGYTPNPYDHCMYSDTFSAVLRKLFLNRKLTPSPIDGVRYPVYDDWMPKAVTVDTSTVYVTMIAVSEHDPYDVIDLTQLDGVIIDGDIRAYMASQGKNLGVRRLAAIHVGLYNGQTWMGDEAITISSDLKVRTVNPMCLRDRYHLRISVLNDLMILTDQARFSLRMQGVAAQKILLTLQQNLYQGQYVPKLHNGIMPDQYLLECANRINRYKKPFYTGLEHRMLTVGNFLISAKRMSDYALDAPAVPTGSVDPADNPNYEPLLPGCDQPRCDESAQCSG